MEGDLNEGGEGDRLEENDAEDDRAKRIALQSQHFDTVLSAAFEPQCKLLASACLDGSIALWNLSKFPDSTRCTFSFTEKAFTVRQVLLSRDGKRLYGTCSDSALRAWSLESDDFGGGTIVARLIRVVGANKTADAQGAEFCGAKGLKALTKANLQAQGAKFN